MTEERYDALLLGGGPAGLAAAERLASGGMRVLLLEREAELGGLARSFRQDGKWIPMTYHHVMGIDTVTHAFLKRFGMWDSMIWRRIKVVFWFHGRPYPLTQPWHIFTFRPLTPIERLRFVRFGLTCYLRRDWHALDAVRCDEWIERMIGRRAREAIFEPLAEMEFGTPLSAVSTGWLGSRLHESARNRDRYGYPSADLKTLIDRIAAAIEGKGGQIMTETAAVRVGRETVEAVGPDGARRLFIAPRIVSAVPPEILLRIHEEPDRLDPELATIRYRPLICMCFGSRHLISPHYWNVFMAPPLRFGGIFNHTALHPEGGASGEYVYYLFSYADEDSPLYRASDEDLAETYLEDIRTMRPGFEYLWHRIFKIPYSTPRYGLGYRNPPVVSRYPGLYHAGVYRRYPCTRTMHTALLSGCETAEAVLKRR
ncbi:MAG: FAD-dependent oxidoreductase [bacterium]|nr:FAD-dependent oxidoreductase [bacterium]